MLKTFGMIMAVFSLTACAPTTLGGGPSSSHLRAENVAPTTGAPPPPVQQTVLLPRPKPVAKTETYSVVVNNVKAQDLLFALARDAKLNVDIHPGISGYVTLNAIDQTLPQLLARISKQIDMRFELDGPNLAVMPDTPYLKSYRIDYVNMARDVTGTVSTNTQISTSALAATTGTTSGNANTSRLQIENKSKNHFWETLDKNLKDLLHETDKIISETTLTPSSGNSRIRDASRAGTTGGDLIPAGSPENESGERRVTYREAASVIANPESGVITVRATHRQHQKVQEFLDQVMLGARRQVLIEATIIEVNLNDNYQQGIDWTKAGDGFGLTRSNNTANVGSTTTPFALVYKNTARGLSVFVDMLRGFGTTKVLSSPKLTVLNNQTATLKVSEDFVYFSVKQDVVPGNTNTNATTTTTTTPQSVPIGFFMSLTAQVSDDDMVTLNVRPSISSISELKQDPNPILVNVKNYVPQIRTREIESILRVQSGNIAVLGGLMEDRMDNKNGRFPLVGDIPLVGEIFNTRNNSSSKTELVIVLRPTVIKDPSIDGDFSHLAASLPGKDFFDTDPIYRPFFAPSQMQEPLR